MRKRTMCVCVCTVVTVNLKGRSQTKTSKQTTRNEISKTKFWNTVFKRVKHQNKQREKLCCYIYNFVFCLQFVVQPLISFSSRIICFVCFRYVLLVLSSQSTTTFRVHLIQENQLYNRTYRIIIIIVLPLIMSPGALYFRVAQRGGDYQRHFHRNLSGDFISTCFHVNLPIYKDSQFANMILYCLF